MGDFGIVKSQLSHTFATDSDMKDFTEQLQAMIDGNIPLVAAAMRIRLLSATDTEVRARLPFEGNANDKGTLFAGAIFSLLVVSGWSLAMARAFACGFERPWAAVVESSCSYKKALRADSVAVATFTEPAEPVVGARNWLQVEVRIDDAVCFRGKYAVGQHARK